MNQKIIALIVTSGERDISKTILSIEEQNKKVYEIIIASEKELESKYKVFVNPYKKGLARNTNQSLICIKDLYPNENIYIATIDDDDFWKKDYIEYATKAIEEGYNFITCWTEVRDNDLLIDEFKFNKKDINIENFIVGNIGIQGSNKIFNLDICLESGMMLKHINASTDRSMNISLLSHPEIKPYVIKEPLVIYQKDSNRKRISNDLSRIEELRNFYKHFDGFLNSEKVKIINERHKKLHKIDKVITWR